MAGSAIAGNLTGDDASPFSGVHDFATPNDYTGKAYTRIWWNSHAARWDGLIPLDEDPNADHYVCEDISGTPNFTALLVEERSTGRPTIFWDDTGKLLHVCSFHGTQAEFWTYDYDTTTANVYTLTVGASANGIDITGINTLEILHTGAMTKSQNNHIWVFVSDGTNLEVQHSTDDGATWESGPTNIRAFVDGSVACCPYNDGTNNRVACFGGEDDAETTPTQVFVHINQADDPTSVGNWTDKTSSLPALDGGADSDNHVSMAVESNNTIHCVYKDSDSDIKTIKYVPSADTFTGSFPVWAGADLMSRPVIGIKKKDGSTDEEIIVVVTEQNSPYGDVFYKLSDTGTVSFGTEQTIINDTVGSDEFRDAVIYQAGFVADSDTGVCVVAENMTDELLWQNVLTITPVSAGGASLLLANRSIANFSGMR